MTRPVDAVRSAVRSALSETGAAGAESDGVRLALVACSGGPDSLVLAVALAHVAPTIGWRAGAVIVDHQLQPGSADVTRAAAQVCRDRGLDPVLTRAVSVTGPGGPEAAARHARYRAISAVAASCGAVAVLTGHTADDQAETVLLGLARGSGARSLSGMSRVTRVPGDHGEVGSRPLLVRPLLGLNRATINAAAVDWDLHPWRDPHNSDPAFTRSRVRHEVIPLLQDVLGPGVVAALARSSDLLRQDADALDTIAALQREQFADDLAAGGDGESSTVVGRAPHLADLTPAVRRRIIRLCARETGVPMGSLTAGHVESLDALVTQWHGQGAVALPGGFEGVRRCGTLVIQPAPKGP